ncbi:MAG: DNA repair protein RecO [Treponema sp.]|nr:DNA repair protein RecO [Treponema sp.]MCL2251091.1 DNA repair protein RecO [Treponema sp.]
MSRTNVYTALILRNRPAGESNNEVTLLTEEEGIIKATVFGGPKSKLRAHCAPFNSGQVWIYRDKSKEYGKLSDFDVRFWRPGLREMYERTMAAGALAETILASHGGGGEWGSALKLILDTLDTLESANEELCGRLLVHFLWRWAGLLGIQPHVDCCAACGKESGGILVFNVHEGALVCAACAAEASLDKAVKTSKNDVKLNPGCRRWLSAVGELDASFLHRYSMDNKSFSEAKALVCAVITGALGKRLASWDW